MFVAITAVAFAATTATNIVFDTFMTLLVLLFALSLSVHEPLSRRFITMQGKSSPAESSTNSPPNPNMNLGSWLSLNPQEVHNQPLLHECPHCAKRFQSLQALGGHQNAHRRERYEARKRLTLERLAYIRTNILPPAVPMGVLQPPSDGLNLGHADVPMLNFGPPPYGPIPRFQPGLGYRPQNVPKFALEFGNGASGSGHVAHYGFQDSAPNGNHYYHPYPQPNYKRSASSRGKNLVQEREVKASVGQVEYLLEASSKTAGSYYGKGKGVKRGEDQNEVTSKRRMDLTLKLSP
ncbi:hypothetical protein L1049_008301 [Liquidambar formosana]|uniref:C2H2-type domain-containing protein n=1 Tax=Liquidambar formosana TaxID=63359 RepID=A0AAP0S9G6_LIQFO